MSYDYDRRQLRASQVPLTPEKVKKIQQEVLTWANNGEVVSTEGDHERLQKAARVWRDRVKDVYSEVMKFAVTYEERPGTKSIVERWRKKFQPLFKAAITVGGIPEWAYWDRQKAGWVQTLRGIAKDLDGVLKYLRTLSKNKMTPQVHELTTEGRVLSGFQVVLVEFNAQDPKHRDALELFEEGLRRYRSRAQKTLPLLLKLALPFKVLFSETSYFSNAGTYGGDVLNINPFQASKPNTLAKTLAHEMGHHLFRVWVTEPKKAFWKGALSKDWSQLDLQEVLDAWRKRDEFWASFMTNLMKTDPILYLQLQGALNFSGAMPKELQEDWSRNRLERYLAEGGKKTIRVPSTPITGYATSNSEEAFCEAVAMLVAYGPRAVLAPVRQWLRIIFGGNVKLGSVRV